jgi:hypothetical protein
MKRTLLFILPLMVSLGLAYGQTVQPSIATAYQAQRYFQNRIVYPEIAFEKQKQGAVIMQFTVLQNGTIRQPVIIFSEEQWLAESVINAIQGSSGFWKNWTKDSATVILPVYFNLDGPPVLPFALNRTLNVGTTTIMATIPIYFNTSIDIIPKERTVKGATKQSP